MRSPFRRMAALGAAAALTLLTACGSSTPDEETPAPAPTAQASEEPDGLDGASTDQVSSLSTDFGLLTDVRVAGHQGYDRVVFEFADGLLPGYTIEYVDLPITEDGSGEPIDIPDAATALQLLFTPASAYDLNSAEPGPSYEGPNEITPTNASQIVQVVSAGDFEAQMVWAVGMPREVPFTVTSMADPARIVIDFETS